MTIYHYKLSCFLHDPIHKPFVLMALKESHVEIAKQLAEIFEVELQEAGEADKVVSAMERGILPREADKNKGLQVRFLENGEIVHPFSGEKLDIKKLLEAEEKPEAEKIDAKVKEIFAKVELPRDARKKFFFLWRNLIPILEAHTEAGLKRLWCIAPADTRLPDHGIFEHLKTTSAFWKTGKGFINHSLFLFTVCPVQAFISQARKTQDLYWGSFILSYLCWCGIKEVAKNYGPDCIIFPDIHGQPLCDLWLETEENIGVINSQRENIYLPTIPNRFLAILPEKNDKELRKIGDKVETAIRDAWKKMGAFIFNRLKNQGPVMDKDIDSEFEQQVNKFFEIYWVAMPFEDDLKKAIEKFERVLAQEKVEKIKKLKHFITTSSHYSPNNGHLYSGYYACIEKALGMRKNIRNFEQLAEKGRKCSICGERNVLFYRLNSSEEERYQRNQNELKKLKQRKLFTDRVSIFIFSQGLPLKYLQPGEGLCAVCMIKRMADKYFKKQFQKDPPEFPSTAKIALLHWLNELGDKRQEEYKQQLKFYQSNGFYFDEQVYFEENLTPKYLKKYGYAKNDKEAESLSHKAKEKLRKFKQDVKIKQTPYYAILMLDGDNMGKWLAGEFTPEIETIYHSRVWENLDEDFKKALKVTIKNRPMTPALHAALSQALKNYALEFVRDIVEKDGLGRLVYAGGDDVLAFVNLHALFDVMLRLRAAFSGHIKIENDKIWPDFTLKCSGFVKRGGKDLILLGPRATASCGVVIAHYKIPLSEVLKQAREMEKYAKEAPEKDAFTIAVLKHSGEIHKTRWSWQVEGEKEGAIGIAKEVLGCLREEIISPHFVRVLRNEFEPLLGRGRNQEYSWEILDMIKIELKRGIKRSFKKGLSKEEKNKVLSKIFKLKKLLEQTSPNPKEIDIFLSFLEIIIFLKREMGNIKNDS